MTKSMFKTKLFGFDKAAVAGYISRAEEKNAYDAENYEQQLSTLCAENRQLRNDISSKSSSPDEVYELKTIISKLREEKADILSELEKLKSAFAKKESEYSELLAQHEAMLKRYESLEEMARQYDKICADVGSLLALAKSKADEITEQAEANSEVIIADARSEADAYLAKIKAESETVIEKNKEKVDFLVKRQKQLLSTLQAHKSEISKFYDETVFGISSKPEQIFGK